MTFADAKKVAEALKSNKPDPASGTVGERLLWGRLVQQFRNTLAQVVNNTRGQLWNDREWCDEAGWEGD